MLKLKAEFFFCNNSHFGGNILQEFLTGIPYKILLQIN